VKNTRNRSASPYDLTRARIKWILFDEAHRPVVEDAYINIVGDPKDGVVSIIVPSSLSASIAGGTYTDALRTTNADGTFTLAMGPIAVFENPEKLAA
jgi:hypothetical protein